MSEELKELPVPFYLSQEEKKESRALYEAIFTEDSKQFVDYYYQYKTGDNEILALKDGQRLVSMLHLNPYRMIVNGYEMKSNYVVAVATHKDYRHRGYMRLLLEKALRDMAAQRMPFTFLMPASEGIYAPFDFVWICNHTALPGRVEQMDAEGQNQYLAKRYQMFCKRDVKYMERQRAERLAEEGEEPSGNLPPYMARITDVCQMLKLAGSSQDKTLYLKVRDPIISQNDGYFRWQVSRGKSVARRLEYVPQKLDLLLTVGELASMIFGSFRICLSEVV